MTYRIEMTQRTDGTDVASIDWNGERLTAASRNGAEMALARLLCNRGAAEGAWVVSSPGQSVTRLHGNSINALGTLTVTEGEGRPKIVPWAPNPRFAKAETEEAA